MPVLYIHSLVRGHIVLDGAYSEFMSMPISLVLWGQQLYPVRWTNHLWFSVLVMWHCWLISECMTWHALKSNWSQPIIMMCLTRRWHSFEKILSVISYGGNWIARQSALTLTFLKSNPFQQVSPNAVTHSGDGASGQDQTGKKKVNSQKEGVPLVLQKTICTSHPNTFLPLGIANDTHKHMNPLPWMRLFLIHDILHYWTFLQSSS